MSDTQPPSDDLLANATREEILAALFANMVIQQTNMAMMLLGKVAHPETGQFIQDIDAAKMFIDQLEMLQEKTKGNLSPQEAALIKQALGSLHMAFVGAVERTPSSAQPPEHPEAAKTSPAASPEQAPAQAAPAPEKKQPAAPAAESSVASDESRKKFTKKY